VIVSSVVLITIVRTCITGLSSLLLMGLSLDSALRARTIDFCQTLNYPGCLFVW